MPQSLSFHLLADSYTRLHETFVEIKHSGKEVIPNVAILKTDAGFV